MKLEKGGVICPKCHGSGNAAEWKQIPDYRAYLKCNHCNGDGKLDWVENVVGKKPLPQEVELERLRKIFNKGNVKLFRR